MLGPFEKISPRSAFEGREVLFAALLSVLWLVLLAGYGAGYFGLFGDLATPRSAPFLEITFFLLALILPLALVWLAAGLMRHSFQIQDEARRLERQVLDLQGGTQSQSRVSQPRIKDNRIETMQQRVSELAGQLKQLETTITSVGQMQTAMQAQLASSPAADQGRFTFDEEPPQTTEPSPGWAGLIRALDFPRDEKDTEGFRALRVAKKDEEANQLLRAAEDILNLLSQEGIYMDDLRPSDASAKAWRLFATGTRGQDVAAVGSLDAPEALERIAERGKTDQIFRDTALYFLRRFDIMLRAFCADANDAEIQMLADTRTGRAFMLLARDAGMFG